MNAERDLSDAQAAMEEGLAAYQAGRMEESAEAFGRAAGLAPDAPDPHLNQGVALKALGRLGSALESFDAALELNPDYAEAHFNRGNLLAEGGREAEAETAYRKATEINPGYGDALNNLGNLLSRQGRFEEAVEILKAIAAPTPEILNNLANAALALDRLDEAEAIFRRAIEAAPHDGRLHLNLGGVLQDRGDLEAARDSVEHAVVLRPDDTDARLRLAMLGLLAGDFHKGFEGYEWRWAADGFGSREMPHDAPRWNGEDVTAKRVLLWAEQGFGDAIQFARYAPLVTERGAEVTIECGKPLARLFESLKGVAAVCGKGQGGEGEYDFQAPLMSLPRVFGTTVETIPADVPYLAAEGSKKKLDGEGLRVGLVWAGRKTHLNDRKRSMPAEALSPLLAVPGVTFYCLQPDADHLPTGVRQLLDGDADFTETAAALNTLDLVITVDTACAHLAGALGKEVWVLLPFAPDWRWLLGRDDSPWYPTARLIRQPAPGDWGAAVTRAADSLKDRAGAG